MVWMKQVGAGRACSEKITIIRFHFCIFVHAYPRLTPCGGALTLSSL